LTSEGFGLGMTITSASQNRHILTELAPRVKLTHYLCLDALGDLSEAQIWVSSRTIYCSKNQREILQEISARLNAQISMFVGSGVVTQVGSRVAIEKKSTGLVKAGLGSSGPEAMPNDLVETVASAYGVILECARKDLSGGL
jgi:hypothetical protein